MFRDRVARCPVFDRTVRFFGDLSGQKYDAKPDSCPVLADLENCTKFGQLILSKIINIVATSCQISRLKCTKFDFGWGSAPDPISGAYSAPPGPAAGFKGPTSKGRGKGGKGRPTSKFRQGK